MLASTSSPGSLTPEIWQVEALITVKRDHCTCKAVLSNKGFHAGPVPSERYLIKREFLGQGILGLLSRSEVWVEGTPVEVETLLLTRC